MPAWWSATLGDFLAQEQESIVGSLSTRLVETHPLNRATQIQAWRGQITLLHKVLLGLPTTWRLLLEYPLLRLQRRIDAVLLTDRAVLVLEFKVGSGSFTNLDRQQVEDYALDLFDFHAESRSHPVIPILVATEATPRITNWPVALTSSFSIQPLNLVVTSPKVVSLYSTTPTVRTVRRNGPRMTAAVRISMF